MYSIFFIAWSLWSALIVGLQSLSLSLYLSLSLSVCLSILTASLYHIIILHIEDRHTCQNTTSITWEGNVCVCVWSQMKKKKIEQGYITLDASRGVKCSRIMRCIWYLLYWIKNTWMHSLFIFMLVPALLFVMSFRTNYNCCFENILCSIFFWKCENLKCNDIRKQGTLTKIVCAHVCDRTCNQFNDQS